MIFVSRKKLLTIFTSIIIGIVCYGVYNTEKETIPTMNFPVTNKVIVIDARTWKTR